MKRSPPPYRPKPTPPSRDRIENANRAMDDHAKGIVRESVRTSFDNVFPGMPPALKLSA